MSEKDKTIAKKAIELLLIEQENGDIECAHGNADDILCKLLIDLDFKSVVDEWKAVEKWYA